ncbi:MAG: sensor histidine kinase, partial [Polaribacter sp.]
FENCFKDLVANYNSDSCKIVLNNVSVLNLNVLKIEKQVVFYRVFNELFVNMKKHSQANLVVISCKKLKNEYEVTYEDNGIGFENNNVILKNGLKNMETHIKSIQGTLTFENKPSKGCKITICFKK